MMISYTCSDFVKTTFIIQMNSALKLNNKKKNIVSAYSFNDLPCSFASIDLRPSDVKPSFCFLYGNKAAGHLDSHFYFTPHSFKSRWESVKVCKGRLLQSWSFSVFRAGIDIELGTPPHMKETSCDLLLRYLNSIGFFRLLPIGVFRQFQVVDCLGVFFFRMMDSNQQLVDHWADKATNASGHHRDPPPPSSSSEKKERKKSSWYGFLPYLYLCGRVCVLRYFGT